MKTVPSKIVLQACSFTIGKSYPFVGPSKKGNTVYSFSSPKPCKQVSHIVDTSNWDVYDNTGKLVGNASEYYEPLYQRRLAQDHNSPLGELIRSKRRFPHLFNDLPLPEPIPVPEAKLGDYILEITSC